jgi:hypothetical protein
MKVYSFYFPEISNNIPKSVLIRFQHSIDLLYVNLHFTGVELIMNKKPMLMFGMEVGIEELGLYTVIFYL